MIKKIFIAIFAAGCCLLFSTEKPVLKTGFNTTGNFKSKNSSCDIYPETTYEKLYLSLDEKFSEFFRFYNRTDFYYYDYNKYNDNLSFLRSYMAASQFYLYFYAAKINEILLRMKPEVSYYGGNVVFSLESYIQYKLKIDNFCFKMKYSMQYSDKPGALFYHNFLFSFYWSHPKYDFIKYKTSLSVYFQHYTSGTKQAAFLKSTAFNFEIALDFNKVDYEDLFDKTENDDFFGN